MVIATLPAAQFGATLSPSYGLLSFGNHHFQPGGRRSLERLTSLISEDNVLTLLRQAGWSSVKGTQTICACVYTYTCMLHIHIHLHMYMRIYTHVYMYIHKSATPPFADVLGVFD